MKTLVDFHGFPDVALVRCRACASPIKGVPQLATHIADGDPCCDDCDPGWLPLILRRVAEVARRDAAEILSGSLPTDDNDEPARLVALAVEAEARAARLESAEPEYVEV
jgi:hypothetical protein